MPALRVCQICQKQADEYSACTLCEAMYYCSAGHRLMHFKMGHAEECDRMRQQRLRAAVRQNRAHPLPSALPLVLVHGAALPVLHILSSLSPSHTSSGNGSNV